MEPFFVKPFEHTSLGELLMGYIRVSFRYGIRHPKELLLLNKCIIEIEGIGRVLDPKSRPSQRGAALCKGVYQGALQSVKGDGRGCP